MKLYLKYGQVVELGNVLTIRYEGGHEVKPFKYSDNYDEVYGIPDKYCRSEDEQMIEFYNDENEVFQCYEYDVIGVLEERPKND